jgi:hypothetical protein
MATLQVVPSRELPGSPLNTQDIKLFAQLRVPKDVLSRCVRRVTHSQAYAMGFRAGTKVRIDGILFPYLDSLGKMVNGRIRLDCGKPKYLTLSQKQAQRHPYILPWERDQLSSAGLEAVCVVESEKAVLALTAAAERAKRNILFVGLGGCWGAWEKRNGESTPLPELEQLKGKRLRLLLDANVANNAQVKLAEENLAVLFGPETESIHLPLLPGVNGPDDFLATQGDSAFWALWDAPAGCPKAGSELAIFLSDPLHLAVERAARILADAPGYKLYRRGDGLVHVVEETRAEQKGIARPVGNTYFTTVDAEHVEIDLSRSGYVFSRNIKTKKVSPADPKRKWAEQVIAQQRSRPESSPFKSIERFSNVPLLLADGRLVETPGYDAENEVWLDTRGVEFPRIPERPTEKQARKALGAFKDIYGTFPFTENSYSVALSLVLSLLLRHLLPTVPIHCFTAPEPGSGKTKTVEAAAGATTGKDVVRMNYRNTEEFEKHLPLPLMAGDPLVLIDNVDRTVTSHELSTAITTAAELEVRKLGETSRIRTLNRSVFAITGNQLRIGGELPRRCLLARINPDSAAPELRRFAFDPPTRARERFPQLAMAALTAVRWYLQAGCPQPDKQQLGSFEEWSRTVRGLLVTLGQGDPIATQGEVRATSITLPADTELLAALHADFGNKKFTVADINKPSDNIRPWRTARKLLLYQDRWDATRAGIRVGKLRDRVLDGLTLRKVKVEHAAVVYQVQST